MLKATKLKQKLQPKPTMRWAHLIQDNILTMGTKLYSSNTTDRLPEYLPLLDMVQTEYGFQVLRGDPLVIADLTERLANAVQRAPFTYNWHPNDEPKLGEIRWNYYEHTRPKLAASLMTHARALRATESFEGRMWRHVNRYGHQIPETAKQFHLSEEEVRNAYQEGENAKYLHI